MFWLIFSVVLFYGFFIPKLWSQDRVDGLERPMIVVVIILGTVLFLSVLWGFL